MGTQINKILILAGMTVCLFSPANGAGSAAEEINYLLQSVAQSNCAFFRNGKEHTSVEAEAHLRMKYERGRSYIDSAEQFIDRMASKSSLSGRTYFMQCSGQERQPSGQWLSEQLTDFRIQTYIP